MKALPLLALCCSCALLPPKPGGSCSADDAICSSDVAALVCRDGKYEATTCEGAMGCKMAKDRTVNCDQSAGGRPGEVCLPSNEGSGHCLSESMLVKCVNGRWAASMCKLCTHGQSSAICDDE